MIFSRRARPPSSTSAALKPRRFGRGRVLALLAVLLAWRLVAPTRWLWGRIQADEAALNRTRPAFEVGRARKGERRDERVLLVSPHLDDETLGAGGLLAFLSAHKIPTRVVFLTNGDGSGSTILALNFWHGRRFSFVESAQVRQREALRALAKLGVEPAQVAFLGYPDGDLQTLWDQWNSASPILSRFTKLSRVPYQNAPGVGSEFRGANLLRDLEAQLELFRPTRVLSTHGADAHPDHWSADAFARLALQVLAQRRPNLPSIEHDGFVIHHGLFPLPHGLHPQARLNVPSALLNSGASGTLWRDFELSGGELKAKGKALEEYVSQLVWTPNFLRAFVRRNEPLGQTPDFVSQGSWGDESQESWALAQHPEADVRRVQVRASAQSLSVEVGLAAPAEPSVLYALNIKGIFEDGRVRAWRFDFRGGQRTAREARSGTQIEAHSQARSVLFSLSLNQLASPNAEKPRRLVLDASSWSGAPEAGGSMLDRTESRALQVLAEGSDPKLQLQP